MEKEKIINKIREELKSNPDSYSFNIDRLMELLDEIEKNIYVKNQEDVKRWLGNYLFNYVYFCLGPYKEYKYHDRDVQIYLIRRHPEYKPNLDFLLATLKSITDGYEYDLFEKSIMKILDHIIKKEAYQDLENIFNVYMNSSN